MSVDEFESPAPPVEDEIQEGDPSSRRPVIIAAVVLVGLLGGVVGLFAAMPGESPMAEVDASVQASAAEWLGAPVPDASSAPAAHSGSSYEPAQEKGADAPDNHPAEEDTAEPVEDDGAAVKKGVVRSGVPVIKNLTGLGVSTGDAQQLINALDGVFDFRRARPGHEFEVRLDSGTGKPTYFRYEASLTDVYIVKKSGDSFVGRKAHIPTQKKTKLFGGTIARSLYSALSDLGAHPALTGKVVDVLSTQVNFYKEQRPGDTFRVMVEEENLDDQFLGYGPVLALEYIGVKAGKKRFFYFKAGNSRATYFDEKGVSVPQSAILVPLHYTRMSSPFGYRFHPVLKRKKLHNGTDFAAPSGTPIWACASGKIIMAGMKGANGNLVAIDHGDGLSSYYAHLSRFASGIRKGTEVKQKQVIGYVGSTGRSTGPHLHWGLKKNGKFLDPLKYKIRPGRPVAAKYRPDLKAVIKQRSSKLDRTRIHEAKGPLAKIPETGTDVLGMEDM